MQPSRDGNRLPVNDLYFTVQGEGVHTGRPAVFLRLHGCPVACPFCDTKETWHYNPEEVRTTLDEVLGANPRYAFLSPSEINVLIRERFPTAKMAVITGGEPALYNLRKLVTALHDGGFYVSIETSGTEQGHLNTGLDWITVSPKINMPGGMKILSHVLESADEIKHAVGRQQDIDNLDALLEGVTLKEGTEICLQPISQSRRATELCIKTAQERGWRVSIQTHKIMNLP